MVGQDLIRAASVRAQISQIEKYQTAVNTFRGKYGYLPGDINSTTAAQFGLVARGNFAGEGDGNSIIEGINADATGKNLGNEFFTGEAGMFWVDLTSANGLNDNLIEGSFKTATATGLLPTQVTDSGVDQFLPQAKSSWVK